MKQQVVTGVKGAMMGAANVVPGLSGGTVALLTNIFEELILSIRSFDMEAIRLLLKGRFRDLIRHLHLPFLIPLGAGIVVSILSVARLLDYLFEHQGVHVWSFFFGLILASIFFVLRRIRTVNALVILFFIAGAAVAASMAFLAPAQQNESLFYLLLCGAAAVCSMILPGLSGSYVLLLMGNYQLVMIDAVTGLRLDILFPVAIGGVLGLALFARLLAWIFHRFQDQAIALLTGFIAGSLLLLWPWKEAIMELFADGQKEKVIGYTFFMPEWSVETGVALLAMLIGAGLLVALEMRAIRRERSSL